MIECIFTIDYEIYGNGTGALRELIYEPAERLRTIFRSRNVPFVAFVEAAELEIIGAAGTDSAIGAVEQQVREFYQEGIEVALHLHPQWYNAKYERQQWHLDYSEYNLCTLPRSRVQDIVSRSLDYLRAVVADSNFTPLSFRAGNWLFQPTETAAEVLWQHGIRLDSSVFKGGIQRNHGLDYRAAQQNGYFWRFQRDVNVADPEGALLEVPTYTVMVPSWRMLTAKRMGLQRKGSASASTPRQALNRYLDLLRPWYPLKFDFCRMTFEELTSMVDDVIAADRATPDDMKPMVAIGHTKDLIDFETIERFLVHLEQQGIPVTRLDGLLASVAPGLTKEPSCA